MKLTEQEIELAAKEYTAQIIETQDRSSEHSEIDFYNGYQQAISQMQPEWVALEKENENLRKTIELAISGLEMYNNTGGLYVDIKLALRASIGMELITVNGDIDARPQPPIK